MYGISGLCTACGTVNIADKWDMHGQKNCPVHDIRLIPNFYYVEREFINLINFFFGFQQSKDELKRKYWK